ncbi:hypothetical protein R1flu_015163 [Riccia fluitans]|uniref:Uncharacterized protein n=1 Tax=Riccia fluitans TaxID=41844 RepID=A0ABD1YLA6_9MARC
MFLVLATPEYNLQKLTNWTEVQEVKSLEPLDSKASRFKFCCAKDINRNSNGALAEARCSSRRRKMRNTQERQSAEAAHNRILFPVSVSK